MIRVKRIFLLLALAGGVVFAAPAKTIMTSKSSCWGILQVGQFSMVQIRLGMFNAGIFLARGIWAILIQCLAI